MLGHNSSNDDNHLPFCPLLSFSQALESTSALHHLHALSFILAQGRRCPRKVLTSEMYWSLKAQCVQLKLKPHTDEDIVVKYFHFLPILPGISLLPSLFPIGIFS